jgi:FkbM family methyltransferase
MALPDLLFGHARSRHPRWYEPAGIFGVVSFRHKVRLFVQRFGIDVSRYPGFDPVHLMVRLLESYRVNVVLDVGANSGRYAVELRRAGYKGKVISFEPLSEPFSILSAQAASDPLWETLQYAIGDGNGTVTLNTAANAGESSSILPMLSAHMAAYPGANYIGTEEATIRTLDDLAPDILERGDRVFLKADVQGYERAVLVGASSILQDHCVGMQLELSLVPLYEGGMLYREALDIADKLGFSLMGLIPGFTDLRNGQLLQADGIFMVDKD